MGSDDRAGAGGPGQGGGSSDDLLRKARRLKRTLEAAEESSRRKQKHSAAGRVGRQVTGLHASIVRAAATLGWIYSHVIVPVVTHRWAGAPFRAYGRLWTRVVHVADEDGDRVFSQGRAGTLVLATAVALWWAPALIAGLGELVWDTAWMTATYRAGEVWYLGKSEEIDPDGNVFSAQGCDSIACTDQTSIYFRIKPSLAHHAWSLYRNGNLFFPDFVAAGIQNDVNKCHVTVYGSRWKLLVRNWDIYPQILSVECVPVTENEIEAVERALREGA